MKEVLIQQIEAYQPYNEQEQRDKEMMLKYLREEENVFSRENKVAHFTASAWVLSTDQKYLLMAYHNIYHTWAWLGGHADGDEDLLRVAIKEVKEESGLEHVHPLKEDIFSLEILTVDGHYKNDEYVSSHLHMNLTYLLEGNQEETIQNKQDENSDVGWFLVDEAISKSSEEWFRENIYHKLNEKLKLLYPNI